ncbi:hypothetical protein [Reichenbachiella versicolor]|uniref:hypothetical protein n=1 Tax=Reichenbachiella versicolor TaxID=1821036 RepID=UPI0013A598C7|nr:hypothetical protein [Reichenbachiella versicolor]
MKTFFKLFAVLVFPFICSSCAEDEMPVKEEKQNQEVTSPESGRGGGLPDSGI